MKVIIQGTTLKYIFLISSLLRLATATATKCKIENIKKKNRKVWFKFKKIKQDKDRNSSHWKLQQINRKMFENRK